MLNQSLNLLGLLSCDFTKEAKGVPGGGLKGPRGGRAAQIQAALGRMIGMGHKVSGGASPYAGKPGYLKKKPKETPKYGLVPVGRGAAENSNHGLVTTGRGAAENHTYGLVPTGQPMNMGEAYKYVTSRPEAMHYGVRTVKPINISGAKGKNNDFIDIDATVGQIRQPWYGRMMSGAGHYIRDNWTNWLFPGAMLAGGAGVNYLAAHSDRDSQSGDSTIGSSVSPIPYTGLSTNNLFTGEPMSVDSSSFGANKVTMGSLEDALDSYSYAPLDTAAMLYDNITGIPAAKNNAAADYNDIIRQYGTPQGNNDPQDPSQGGGGIIDFIKAHPWATGGTAALLAALGLGAFSGSGSSKKRKKKRSSEDED